MDTFFKNVRTRYAPSPTGDPHIGNIRTALFNWLFAKHCQGEFILRIEDTDQARLVPGSLEKILESLEWLGLDYNNKQSLFSDENKFEIRNSKFETNSKFKIQNSKREHKSYFQSERLEIYQKYAEELVEKEKAYYCYCSEQRLKELREKQIKEKKLQIYDSFCREKNQKPKKNEKYVIRMKTPQEGTTEFNDFLREKISFENKFIDDTILLKNDGWPTYNFANVVDDHLMKISHVIRGEEFISSMPKHILLYQAFDWPLPYFIHLPLILGSDKSKLSKRHGAISVLDLRGQGYLAEAVINFIVLLGWHPDKSKIEKLFSQEKNVSDEKSQSFKEDIFSKEELIELFSLEDLQKSPAIFNFEKLDWMNGYYIRKMELDKLTEIAIPFLEKDKLISVTSY